MKRFLTAIAFLILPLHSALAQDELAKKLDPTTMTILGAMVIGVIFAIAWVFYADRQDKRRRQRRRGG